MERWHACKMLCHRAGEAAQLPQRTQSAAPAYLLLHLAVRHVNVHVQARCPQLAPHLVAVVVHSLCIADRGRQTGGQWMPECMATNLVGGDLSATPPALPPPQRLQAPLLAHPRWAPPCTAAARSKAATCRPSAQSGWQTCAPRTPGWRCTGAGGRMQGEG